MAKQATVSVGLDISSLKKSLGDALGQLNKLTGAKPNVKVDVDVNDKEINDAKKSIASLSSTQNVKVNVDTSAVEKQSKQSGGAISSLFAGAIGGGIASIGAAAIPKLTEAAKTADALGDNLQLAFATAGLSLEQQNAELAKSDKFARSLSDQYAISARESKALLAQVVGLTGQTGKSAEDITKFTIGIEKASGGLIKAESAAKILAKGVDPENQQAIEVLAKRFPQLAESLKSTAPLSDKVSSGLTALNGTFSDLERQAKGPTGALDRLSQTFDQLFQDVANPIFQGLAPLFDTLGKAIGPLIAQLLPIATGIIAPLTPVLEQIGKLVIEVVSALSGPFTNLLDAVLNPLVGLIQQILPVLLQVIQIAMKPLTQIIEILAQTFRELFPALQPIFDVIVALLPTVAQLAGELLTALVPVIKSVAGLFVTLVKAITQNKVIMAALNLVLQAAIGIIRGVVGVVQFFAGALDAIIGTIDSVIQYITRLINAIASFDLNTIKNALLGIDEPAKVAAKSVDKVTASTEEAAKATNNLADANNNLKKNPPPKPDPEAAKKYAEALAKAREQLAGLTTEQQKARELAATDDIANEEERAKKRIEIEQRYQIQALEAERKALESKGKLREAEEAVINKRIEILREENARKIEDIEAKARQNALKLEEENQKKLDDITAKFASDRLEKLKAQLAAGNASVANELISAQRSVLEFGLSNALDAIVEQTPAFQNGIKELNAKLAAGLSVDEYRKQAAALRQGIFQELQSLPSDTTDIYALQIRAAYTKAGDEIAKGTAEIVAQIRQQQVKQAGDIFADSLRGIGEALRSVDFATIYGDAAKQAASLNEEQEKLIQNLKDGETTYQDAVDSLAELTSKQEGAASATAQAIAQSFQAIADQQAKAAEDGINKRNENLERIRQIADEELQVAKDKAAALKAIEDQTFEDEQTRQAARDAVNKDFAQKEKNLTNERDKLAKESEQVQTAALNNLAVSAGAAFASLVAGGENAGEALKKVVGNTVSSLIDLYTPSILALFSSIIPPPFGQLAGLAAIAGIKALLQSALNGFEEGGYTGNAGTKQVAGVVHGQEFVMTADVTRKNRALLEHLHAGRSIESFPALQKMLADNQIQSIPVTELQLMRGELSAIRQRLDSMPNGIQGQMGVDVNVGMDTYLYERDRSRMIARKLRG